MQGKNYWVGSKNRHVWYWTSMEDPVMSKDYFDKHRDRDPSTLDFWIEYRIVDDIKNEIQDKIKDLEEEIAKLKAEYLELQEFER